MSPLAAELTFIVEAIEQENPGIFGQSGAYGQAFALLTCAMATGTMLGPPFSGVLVANYGWNFMTLMLAVLSTSGAIPVVRASQPSPVMPTLSFITCLAVCFVKHDLHKKLTKNRLAHLYQWNAYKRAYPTFRHRELRRRSVNCRKISFHTSQQKHSNLFPHIYQCMLYIYIALGI